MKRFLYFLLPFLFVRDWHEGDLEFSRDRVVLFCGALIFILVGILIVAFLQSPVEYAKSV